MSQQQNIFRTEKWWQAKAGNILALVYLSVYIYNVDLKTCLLLFGPAVITILGIGAFGHLVNDYSDLEDDERAGKKNVLAALSFKQRIAALFASLLLALIPWAFLPYTTWSIILLVAEFSLLIIYAVSPFRLKNRGFPGLIADALYAYAIPALLAFYTFSLAGDSNSIFGLFFLLFIWQFFIGLFNIALHQVEDFENDVRSNTPTWATLNGQPESKQILIRYIFPLHIFSWLAFVLIVAIHSSFIYAVLPAIHFIQMFPGVFQGKHGFSLFNRNYNGNLQAINIHYHRFLPYWHLFLLGIGNTSYFILMVGHFMLFRFSEFLAAVRPSISLVVNYTILYHRLYIQKQSPQQAYREHYPKFSRQIEARKRLKKGLPAIVLANKNKSKYSETFVQNHIEGLNNAGYYVHQLYGGYLPTKDAIFGDLLTERVPVSLFYKWIESVFDYPEGHFYQQRFIRFLISNNVSIVLAEFGTCGAEIFPLCKEAGIPLVVIFHGYDANHSSTVNENRNKYEHLFNYASAVICVSKDICSKLESIGAPGDKLHYLPCGIDTRKIEYSDHSANAKVFLAVGRFAETKSPHLTILAFSKVLKKIPEAKLIMIGKDDGGAMFEACFILAKALNIESNIVFKGILSPDQVIEEMKMARVFVQHSVTTPLHGDKEGTPVSVMEAMAIGLPVVATRHAGIAEMIIHNETGVLVEEYDIDAMADEMIRICENDNLVFRLGKAASESIRNNPLISENILILSQILEKYRLK